VAWWLLIVFRAEIRMECGLGGGFRFIRGRRQEVRVSAMRVRMVRAAWR
jgi:hypothetical protein